MSLGTLAINNNSDQVAGTNTSFTTELKINDFIAVPSGGVTYTMVVKAITSDTALTITRPFSGPNVTGANWAAIPAGTMVGVTAKIADDTSYTMRMYVNEATNWMNLLTVDGDVTVYAPDGSSYTGPSWLKLSRIMDTLDMPVLTTIAAQIHADAVQVASDTQTTTTNKNTAVQAASTAMSAATTATQAAGTATTKAGEASASATTAKNEADRAATANPDNQLKKANNLSDVADIPTARTNLQIDRLIQQTNNTAINSPDKSRALIVQNSDTWGLWSNSDNTYKPLKIEQGGTNAKDAATARATLEVPGLTTANTFTSAQTFSANTGMAGTRYPAFVFRPNNENGQPPANTEVAALMLESAYNSSVGLSLSFIRRRLDGNQTGQIAITLPNTTGVLALQGTSGRDYKTDIHPADSAEALDRILSLELVNYVYKDDEQNRQRFGIIAEDAEKIAPQYIKHNQESVPGTEVFDEEGRKISQEYQDRPSVDNNPIVMDLLGAVQNLQNQIKELKETIAILSSK